MDKKMLFLDLDGTLLDDSKHITQGNRDALKRILSHGHRVIITTGRPLPSALRQARLLQLDRPGCYLIACNGGLIYDWSSRREIYSRTISCEDAAHIFQLAGKLGLHIQTYDDKEILVEQCGCDEALERYSRATEMGYRVLEDIRRDLHRNPVKCLAIDWDSQIKLKQLQSQIQTQYPDRLDAFFSCDAYLEIVPKGISKGEAVRMLCQQLEVSTADAVAVGDAQNDIPMLQAAGIGVAMCNAVQEVKAAADAVTTRDNNHDGVAQVIEWYFERSDRPEQR